MAQNYLDRPIASSPPSNHAALLFALSAGLAVRGRVVLGARYPTDNLAGALGGLVAGLVVGRGPVVRLADGLTTFGEWVCDAPLRALQRRFR